MNNRNLSLDIFRALTMALMVFVNDFWTVLDVPHFLEHYGTWEDGMGLSDFVFPMFLFAMGMSVPYALENRLARGASLWDCFRHILSRTLALLLMGTFIVNSEVPMAGNKGVYWLVMVAGFFLVWNHYPKDFKPARWLRMAGIVMLCVLAATYRSAEGDLFRASWWGILGQIGWMYLFTATAYLLCRNCKWVLGILWAALCLLNIGTAPLREGGPLVPANFLADFARALQIGNGHSVIMSMGGLLTSLFGLRLKESKPGLRTGIGLAAAAVLAVLGMAAHQGWIISKNLGTLPWCLLVSATSVALYTLLRVVERKGWTAWSKPLTPAGTATLTVYMMPYVFYSFWVFLNPTIPLWLSGWVGIVKCALFSALCIFCTWAIGKAGIKLKI